MSTEQLTAEAVSLPLAERVTLAQTLWNSLEGGLIDGNEAAEIAETVKRDNDLTSGRVVGRTHEQVMQAAKRIMRTQASARAFLIKNGFNTKDGKLTKQYRSD